MSSTAPARPEARMSAAEVVAEAEWLLDGGVHPLVIAEQLSYKPQSIARAAQRLRNRRVTHAFGSLREEPRNKAAA